MHQAERYCKLNPLLVCISNECQRSSGWLCSECLKRKISLQEQQRDQNQDQYFVKAYDFLQSQQMQLETTQEIISKLNYQQHIILDHAHQILSVSISKNGKYLAYGGYHNQLVIYDLQLKEIYFHDRLQECMMVSQFSQDSKLLYLGCQKGQLLCYDLEKKLIQKQRMNPNQSIQNLVLKENSIVIFTIESHIFIFEMKKEILLFKIDQISKKIFGLDYNVKQDIIVTGSIDQKIMIYDGSSRQLILTQEQAHQDGILQIQILNNDRLLTKDNKQVLKQWSIDYNNKNLVIIREIRNILNFYSIRNDYILIIQKEKFQILNQKLLIIYEQPHGKGDDVQERAIQQLKSIEYLLILGKKQLLVLKQSEIQQQNYFEDSRQKGMINESFIQ